MERKLVSVIFVWLWNAVDYEAFAGSHLNLSTTPVPTMSSFISTSVDKTSTNSSNVETSVLTMTTFIPAVDKTSSNTMSTMTSFVSPVNKMFSKNSTSDVDTSVLTMTTFRSTVDKTSSNTSTFKLDTSAPTMSSFIYTVDKTSSNPANVDTSVSTVKSFISTVNKTFRKTSTSSVDKPVSTISSFILVDKTSSSSSNVDTPGYTMSETISNQPTSLSLNSHHMSNLSKTISTSSTYNVVRATSTAIYVVPDKPKPLIIAFSILVIDEFSTNLNDQESLAYLKLESMVQKLINAAYKNNTEFLLTNIVGFESKAGHKVQCNGRLYFNSSYGNVNKLKQALDKYLKSQNNGVAVTQFLETKPKPQDKDSDDDDDVVFGLDWWQIGVIIAGIVVLILLVAVVILWAKLRKIKKNNYTDSLSYGNEMFGFDNNNGMKALRASPTTRSGSEMQSQDVTLELNRNKTGTSSFLNSSGTKGDGLVRQTEAKIGVESEKNDDDKNEYVIPLTSVTAPGDVNNL